MPREGGRGGPKAGAGRAAPLLYGAVFATFVAMYLPQPILPQLAEAFGTRASEAGLLMSALVLGIAAGSLLLPPLSDRLGRRPVLVGCCAGVGAATLAAAAAPSFGLLLVLRAVQGALVPGVLAVAVADLSERAAPERLAPLLGGHIAATVAGGLASRAVGGAATQWLHWRWGFVAAGVLCLLVAVLVWALLPAAAGFRPRAHLREAYAGLGTHLRDPSLLLAYGLGACLFFSFLGIFTYLPFRLALPPFSYPPALTGVVYVVYVAGIVSSPLAGGWARRLGAERLLALAVPATLVAAVATLTDRPLALLAALLALCFANFTVQSGATSLVASRAERDRAGANALYLFAYYVGGTAGGFLPGLAWQAAGWPGVVAVCAGALVIGSSLALALALQRKG